MKDLSFDLVAGEVKEIAPGVRAIVAGNEGPFTFKGTVTYIVGQGQVAIIDPGPDEPAHIDAVLEALRNETVTHVFVTHTHRDHSCASGAIKARTGAMVLAEGPHRLAWPLDEGDSNPLDANADFDFRPDFVLRDKDTVTGPGWTIEAVATPGHTPNHMAYALREASALFSGDHVMAWSTSIVAPPDGLLSDYMASLWKLQERDETVYFPGHGNPVRNVPLALRTYIRHRQGIDASICKRLSDGPMTIPALVRAIYGDLDAKLAGALCLSLLAHVEDLMARQNVIAEGPSTMARLYRLAA